MKRIQAQRPRVEVNFQLDEEEAIILALLAGKIGEMAGAPVHPDIAFLIEFRRVVGNALANAGVAVPDPAHRFRGTPLDILNDGSSAPAEAASGDGVTPAVPKPTPAFTMRDDDDDDTPREGQKPRFV